jgi:hypothetical protein
VSQPASLLGLIANLADDPVQEETLNPRP